MRADFWSISSSPSSVLPQTSALQKRHVKRRARHTENEFGPCKSPGASLLRYVGRARRQPRRKRPIGPQKSTSAASQGARAAQEATDAAPGTLTRRRQPALARGCSSPRVGARSTPRRPERDRGSASPGHYLGDGVPLTRNWRPQRPRQRGPSADLLDCACLWAGRALVRRGVAGRHTSTCSNRKIKQLTDPTFVRPPARTRRRTAPLAPHPPRAAPATSARQQSQ